MCKCMLAPLCEYCLSVWVVLVFYLQTCAHKCLRGFVCCWCPRFSQMRGDVWCFDVMSVAMGIKNCIKTTKSWISMSNLINLFLWSKTKMFQFHKLLHVIPLTLSSCLQSVSTDKLLNKGKCAKMVPDSHQSKVQSPVRKPNNQQEKLEKLFCIKQPSGLTTDMLICYKQRWAVKCEIMWMKIRLITDIINKSYNQWATKWTNTVLGHLQDLGIDVVLHQVFE